MNVDANAGRIFWTERSSAFAKPSRIQSADLNGMNVRTICEFTGEDYATAIAIGRRAPMSTGSAR
jgi:hypothetical protein